MKEWNRFDLGPDMMRVSGGKGGEAFLVIGSEKTVLYDCGMAYSHIQLIENIRSALGDRTLDYVVLSHTHYDHLGALPYLRASWPDLISYGAAYGKAVLEKTSALNQIKKLSSISWEKYKGQQPTDVLMDGMRIDEIICENDIILLGNRSLRVFETPGHTNCSLSFLLEPDFILFPSESTGVYTGYKEMHSGMLKSYRQSLDSIEKCSNLSINGIIAPHYGRVQLEDQLEFWSLCHHALNETANYIIEKFQDAQSFQDILAEYTNEFWVGIRREEQPREAFLLNAEPMIRNVLKERNAVCIEI